MLCLAGSVAAFSDNALMLVPALGIAAFFAAVAGYWCVCVCVSVSYVYMYQSVAGYWEQEKKLVKETGSFFSCSLQYFVLGFSLV